MYCYEARNVLDRVCFWKKKQTSNSSREDGNITFYASMCTGFFFVRINNPPQLELYPLRKRKIISVAKYIGQLYFMYVVLLDDYPFVTFAFIKSGL